MRRAARTDANHSEIAQAARGVGAGVIDLHAAGVKDLPDLLIAYHGETILCEIVVPDGDAWWVAQHEKRRADWHGGRWIIVNSVAGLLGELGIEVQA